MNWWGHFWLRTLTWAFPADAPVVHGGNMAIIPPTARQVRLSQRVFCARYEPRMTCRVREASARAQTCTVRRLPRPVARTHVVRSPSVRFRYFTVPLRIEVQSQKLALARATRYVSQRVLVCRERPAVRARIRLLPRRAQVVRAEVRWRCRPQWVNIERFGCRSIRSSLVKRLPITRRAVPFRWLTEDQRRLCQQALQRTATGYVRVESVYYPVPAHAIARIEIDERRGVLYVHPRKGRSESAPACLWVVSGVQVADGRPVRAVLRVA